MLKRAVVVVVVLVGFLTVLGVVFGVGQDDEGERMGKAFCADIADGFTPFQILKDDLADTDEEEIAADVNVWTSEQCPELRGSNGELRRYLRDWGYES